MAHYTYITINKKVIRIEEAQTEHDERMERIRKANRAQEFKNRMNELGVVNPDARAICPNCGDKKLITKYIRSGNWYCKHCGYAPKTYTNGPKQ